MNMTLTQSVGYDTKRYLETAHYERNSFKTHFIGRFQLLGTTAVGTVEIISRIAFFLFGNFAAAFSFYQSPHINQFLSEQIQEGFSAAMITSGSLFALLSPDIFRTIQFPQEMNARQEEEVRPLRGRVNQELMEDEQRIVELVMDIVRLPFQIVALTFKLPFYCIYVAFQVTVILPLRLMLLPLQIFTSILSCQIPRDPFQFELDVDIQ